MTKVKIEFEVEIDDDNIKQYSEDELEEFLRFEFRDNGVLSGDNPFNKENC